MEAPNMAIKKDVVFAAQDENEGQYYTADVILPELGSEHDVPVVIPETMKPLNIEALPLRVQAGFALLAELSKKAHEAGVENPQHTITEEMIVAKVEQLMEGRKEQD
jgi:hypothetical protein